MVPALALLFLQAPLTAEQIHVEDAKVIEAVMIHDTWPGYWKFSKVVYYESQTVGPLYLGEAIVQGYGKEELSIGPEIRKRILARNAYPIYLKWLHPIDSRFRAAAKDWQASSVSEWGKTYRLFLPGYSKDGSKAVVCYGHASMPHYIRETAWLTKSAGRWKVTNVRFNNDP